MNTDELINAEEVVVVEETPKAQTGKIDELISRLDKLVENSSAILELMEKFVETANSTQARTPDEHIRASFSAAPAADLREALKNPTSAGEALLRLVR
ncbi:MAG: hypothetical protein LBV09_04080 [Deferribacteraceae bacterium]|jgi:uncharacterized protein (DUF1778 family)|nr:hypothetical protein [Deferribacteraceae bacterium]